MRGQRNCKFMAAISNDAKKSRQTLKKIQNNTVDRVGAKLRWKLRLEETYFQQLANQRNTS